MPIKARWVYDLLNILEPGDKNDEINRKIDQILFEIAGKESRRKIKTILLRYFVETKKIDARTIEVQSSPLLYYSKNYDFQIMKPLYLEVLLIRSNSIRIILNSILKKYENINFKRKDVMEIVSTKFGQRRSTEKFVDNFLKVMVEFDIFSKIDTGVYAIKPKIKLNEKQKVLFILLYSYYTKTSTIELQTFDLIQEFNVFDLDFDEILQKYNGKLWQLSYRAGGYLVYITQKFDIII
ncbi:hypothetical protein MFS40622_0901 [Methanocaldococcus sp. FS406-22]|nr:hypothetical protein MFS40622_0901 [Methanocaldococcus sp. FS406-22]